MKVMIADDHPLYVEALENLLRSDFEIVSTVDNGSKAVTEAHQKHPDVILMDINMPVLNGIEATRKILFELPEIKIIMLTCFEEKESLFRAVKAGASGYLLKNLDGKEIIEGLRELEKGRNPFAPGFEACILQEFQQQSPKDTSSNELADQLSDRQIEVLALVAQGLTDPRVPPYESEQIVAALKARGVPVEYVVFPDEGHGFLKRDNKRRIYEAVARFLRGHLRA